MRDKDFWKHRPLSELTHEEWEALCDGCGLCCLVKLEDEDTGELVFTRLVCHLFDIGRCRCTDYENRHTRAPDCRPITPDSALSLPWLPTTCAYRRLAEGKSLPDWHHLVSGDPELVHRMGLSARGWTRKEDEISEEDLPRYIIPCPFPLWEEE